MDTPDTVSKSELSDSDEDLEIEYEVQSLSENENAPVGSNFSSGAEYNKLENCWCLYSLMCSHLLNVNLV
ncbi:hypothetical protein RN001_003644 [Aquatica leii]|uniref:Uncharacterized protein n=1 Tax=Aquatica leii TaxID=1421715 RepID=A0AAN7QP79_9COLE|nr:hypothetical protein RN001_003644 [Aquatica leii]